MSPILLTLLALGLSSAAFAQQQKEPEKKATIASVLDQQLSIVEHEFVSAAEAMPEDKYSFAPTNGEFKGVRTFAQQVKHVAAANYLFFSAILGEKPPEREENGPESVKTKDQILKYLRDSFAVGHRAFATITPENAVTPVEHPLSGPFNNRLAIASIACWHPFDHYGQMVEYLRMNGIIPPASRPQPPKSGQ
jgi:uncharacterized damage-inducible protein DinB